MNISRGVIPSAKKVVVYGPEGIGKSTFASMFPDPVFIDTEGSTKNMDVARFPAPENWERLQEMVEYAMKHPSELKTLVIDTADWAEALCIDYTCRRLGVKGIEDVGYGKGYTYLSEDFKKLLDELEQVVKAGINVVVTAHAYMRKFEQPDEMGAYDRWELKLQKKTAPLLKEWADMVLFANYKTYVIEDSKTKSKKGSGSKRVMYATHHACWDAKNRYGLPDEMSFEYAQIKNVIESTQNDAPNKEEKKKTVYDELRELMERDGIEPERLAHAVAAKTEYFSDAKLEDYSEVFVRDSLIAKWNGFCKFAKSIDMDKLEDGIPFK